MTLSLLRWMEREDSYRDLNTDIEAEKALTETTIKRKIGNPMQKAILGIMLENNCRDFSINEIADIMSEQRSTISARMNELRKMGLLIFSKKRISRVTGKPNDAYKLCPNFEECVEILDD